MHHHFPPGFGYALVGVALLGIATTEIMCRIHLWRRHRARKP